MTCISGAVQSCYKLIAQRYVRYEAFPSTGNINSIGAHTTLLQLKEDIVFATDFAHEDGVLGHLIGTTAPLEKVAIGSVEELHQLVATAKGLKKTLSMTPHMHMTLLKVCVSDLPHLTQGLTFDEPCPGPFSWGIASGLRSLSYGQ